MRRVAGKEAGSESLLCLGYIFLRFHDSIISFIGVSACDEVTRRCPSHSSCEPSNIAQVPLQVRFDAELVRRTWRMKSRTAPFTECRRPEAGNHHPLPGRSDGKSGSDLLLGFNVAIAVTGPLQIRREFGGLSPITFLQNYIFSGQFADSTAPDIRATRRNITREQ